ncbi:hypothetical protein SERLA73DRAFT_90716 [Serpula lacrymans var. lacrymans S7.3]|uniref:BRCT domain-containing protein n=1 Tax=Serpula lacrymans var. lacrymans (strain S7.3) TaxID=936435 RepID=F8PX90_SERL3|nr:hypothetical protein SERLA73DRAFT_90716 [Serpula lacrymans var. lacrymans S7.3]
MQDLCPRPFKGFTLCATGIVDKSTLFKQAFELGATSNSDFTDKVTHLIASDHGGAKYMCAIERKIPIMRPEWIHDAYEVWLRGDDVELQDNLEKYRLPVFSGVILSLSGIDDIPRRTQINQLVTQQGGMYLKNLERPVKVTHLLCSGDVETEKMKYAEKFNKRREAKIQLVWEEWFWDSLEFGGRVDERRYQVNRPRPERKSFSFHEDPTTLSYSAPGSRPETAIPVDPPPAKKPAREVGPSNQDEDEEETGQIKRVPTVTLQLWESLLKPRGFEVTEGKLIRSPSKSQAGQGRSSPQGHPTKPPARAANPAPLAAGSVISSFRRTNSFAPVAKESSARQPFRRTSTLSSTNFLPVNGPADAEGSNLFSGRKFRLLGEARSASVRSAIEQCGGILVSEEDMGGVDFIIVRLISGSKLYQREADEQERSKYRTECWLEHSVFKEYICPPEENVSFTPLKVATPIPSAELVNLSVSGLDEAQLCWVRRLLRALGIHLMPNFSRRSTHLLCPSGTGAKFDKAKEWSIPVVSLDWLVHMATKGVVPDVGMYMVGSHYLEVEDGLWMEDDVGHVAKQDKGKEKAVDVQMEDSTNTLFTKKPNLLEDKHVGRSLSLLDFDPAAEHDMFGKPNGFLGSPPSDVPPSSPPAAPPLSSSPGLEYLDVLNPPPPPPRGHSRHMISQAPTLPSIDIDAEARIPSSKSPSPMKLPPSSDPAANSSFNAGAHAPSPIKFENQVTRALQESITTLLGKRQISEEDMAVPVGRGKRVRPHSRTKPQSRQGTRETIDILRAPDLLHQEPVYDEDAYNEMNILEREGEGVEESLRVTYEDPEQRLVRQRLLSLFGDQAQARGGNNGDKNSHGNININTNKGAEGSKANGMGVTRRSTRVAGF